MVLYKLSVDGDDHIFKSAKTEATNTHIFPSNSKAVDV